MQFKTENLKDEFAHAPTMLQVMAIWFEQLSVAHFGIDPVVTRVLEKVAGSSGVHEAGRAVDFRDEHAGKRTYTPEQVEFLVSEMNRRFPRKDKRKTCMHHSFKGGAFHFHIQVEASNTHDELDCYTVI